MSRDELLQKLRALVWDEEHAVPYDPERTHGEADELLIEYINDSAVTEYYRQLTRWCA
jgi:hypothetical protein